MEETSALPPDSPLQRCAIPLRMTRGILDRREEESASPQGRYFTPPAKPSIPQTEDSRLMRGLRGSPSGQTEWRTAWSLEVLKEDVWNFWAVKRNEGTLIDLEMLRATEVLRADRGFAAISLGCSVLTGRGGSALL